jgi:hypothetical protein
MIDTTVNIRCFMLLLRAPGPTLAAGMGRWYITGVAVTEGL